jgi:hypothetical protein
MTMPGYAAPFHAPAPAATPADSGAAAAAPDSPRSQLSGSMAASPACLAAPARPPASIAAAAAAAAAVPRRPKAPAGGGADPSWPSAITGVHFFAPCDAHPAAQKNECHYYCVGCTPTTNRPMCQHCLPAHAAACGAEAFQVYRYMYHDVIRIANFRPLLPDLLADIQAYKANGHPAVHLRQREMPKTKSPAGFTGRCGGCGRCLSSEWTYCSLACKLGIEGCPGATTPGGAPTAAAGGGGGLATASHSAEPRRRAWSDDESHGGAGGAPARRTRGVQRARTPVAPLAGAKRRKMALPRRSDWA